MTARVNKLSTHLFCVQVSNMIVWLDQLLWGTDPDVFCSVGIFQCVQRVFIAEMAWRDVGDHHLERPDTAQSISMHRAHHVSTSGKNQWQITTQTRSPDMPWHQVTVRQLPPRESLRSRVSFESRKGTKAEPEAKALIQLPNANRDRLILAPSKSRMPLLCVCEARSEPAKSIKDNLPRVVASRSRRSTRTWKTAWERDDVTFMTVGSVVRRWFPPWSNFMTSSTDWAWQRKQWGHH